MALYTRVEFATLCGQTNGNLSNYIKRGKVNINEAGLIDDQDPVNKSFLAKQLDKSSEESKEEIISSKKEPVQKPSKKQKRVEKFFDKIPDPESEEENLDGDYDNLNGYQLEKKLKAQELKKKKAETRLLNLREEKIRGEVIPIDLVKTIFNLHTQSILTSQKESLETLLINISVETRMSDVSLAKLRGKMVKLLNEGVDRAIAISQNSITSLMEEFSIKKEVGEHN